MTPRAKNLFRPARRHLRPALSLTETMLALFITSLIGVTAVTVLAAASSAQKSSKNYAETVQAGRAGLDRVQRTIRRSKLVTAASTTELVLWTGDRQDLGYINADEVAVVKYDATAKTIVMTKVTFPATLSDATKRALNAQVGLAQMDTSAHAVTAMANSAYRGDTILAADVQACAFAVSPDVPETTAVTVRATFGTGAQQLSLVSTTRLHASEVPLLDYDDETGEYSLDEPAEEWGDLPVGLK